MLAALISACWWTGKKNHIISKKAANSSVYIYLFLVKLYMLVILIHLSEQRIDMVFVHVFISFNTNFEFLSIKRYALEKNRKCFKGPLALYKKSRSKLQRGILTFQIHKNQCKLVYIRIKNLFCKKLIQILISLWIKIFYSFQISNIMSISFSYLFSIYFSIKSLYERP